MNEDGYGECDSTRQSSAAMQLICQPRPGRTRRAGAGRRMALRSRERRVREYRIISCDKRRKHTSSKDRTGLKSGMRRPAWSWWCIHSPSSLTSVVLLLLYFVVQVGEERSHRSLGQVPPLGSASTCVIRGGAAVRSHNVQEEKRMKPSSVLRALCLARNTALVAAYPCIVRCCRNMLSR